MKSVLFLILFGCLPLWATTFQIQRLDQQLREADGVMEGHYLKSHSITLENGRVATQMIFRIQREFGLQSELFGMDEVIIHYPGGQVGDLRVEVQGVPKFIPGEKVVIFTRSVDNRYWGLNLGMGTYKMVNYGNKTMLVNTLFPNHPEMGQVPLDKFEDLVRQIKGVQLKVVTSSHLLEISKNPETAATLRINQGQNRTIASHEEEVDNETTSTSFKTFWLLVLLAFLGTCFRFAHRP